MNLLSIKRVLYGKESTPEIDREYCTAPFGPVGNITEWTEYAKHKYEGLLVTELNNTTHEVIF